MQDQSSLGSKTVNRNPSFNADRLARVTSVKDLYTAGRIEAVFLDFSQPSPVWVVGDLDREPVEGDMIVIGYLDARKDAPYMRGFVKNQAYTTHFMIVKKDKIKLQLPIFEIGVKDGKAHKDVQEHLLDNAKQVERAYVELVEDHAIVSFPTSEDEPNRTTFVKLEPTRAVVAFPTGNTEDAGNAYVELNADHTLVSFPLTPDGSSAATIKITADGIFLDHPTGVFLGSEGKAIARVGDTISGTTSDGKSVDGTITSGSSKIKS